jgi:hypothetical protein
MVDGSKQQKQQQTREQWLEAAVKALAPRFLAAGSPLPTVRVSVGFPSLRACSTSKARWGECWDKRASADGSHQIFITPREASGSVVLAVLVHELCHAAVGCKAGHRAPFARLAKALGLTGKMTATTAGPELQRDLEALEQRLGAYPHAALNAAKSGIKKQTTRLLLAMCPACGYKLRVTRQWAEIALPTCTTCDCRFELA